MDLCYLVSELFAFLFYKKKGIFCHLVIWEKLLFYFLFVEKIIDI